MSFKEGKVIHPTKEQIEEVTKLITEGRVLESCEMYMTEEQHYNLCKLIGMTDEEIAERWASFPKVVFEEEE